MDQEQYILYALAQTGELTIGQISRFLFGLEITDEYDLLPPLAVLKEKQLVNQVLKPQGIVLELSEEGESFLASEKNSASDGVKALITQKAEEYKHILRREQDYLAQYSEQSSGIVSVTLSIRNEYKVIMRVNLIVHNVDSAKKICSAWIKNSGRAYEALWEAVSEGQPFPGFWTERSNNERGSEYGARKTIAADA